MVYNILCNFKIYTRIRNLFFGGKPELIYEPNGKAVLDGIPFIALKLAINALKLRNFPNETDNEFAVPNGSLNYYQF